MRRAVAIILFALSVLVMSAPQAVLAAPCDCWCGTEVQGAVKEPNKLEPTTCKQTCEQKDAVFLSCATKLDEHPDTYPYCFTPEQCQNFVSADGKTTGRYESPVDHCTQSRGYCYPVNTDPIALTFAIGSTTSVKDLGDYINVIYKFALGASVTFAIVMLMVGGLQYILAAQSGNVKAAKERMTHALVGLVLLFGVYVMLFAVNPQLVSLQAPQLPMIRPTATLQGFSCEELIRQGFTIGDQSRNVKTTGTCGENGQIIKDDNGIETENGTVCGFSACTDGTRCVISNGVGSCVACADVVGHVGATTELDASESICNQLSGGTKTFGTRQDVLTDTQCWFSRDRSVAPPAVGACVEMELNCQTINTCKDYDDVPLRFSSDVSGAIGVVSGGQTLDDIEGDGNFGTTDRVNIRTVCQQDLCRWHRDDKELDCMLLEIDGQDCVNETEFRQKFQ